jgi:serine phosphatase RsbU (regulator of sigma subunit)
LFALAQGTAKPWQTDPVTRRSIVLIEDDPGDAFLVTEMLLDVAPDVAVVTFSSLHSALSDWPDDPDCVLLDLGLPDAFGLTALEKLRAQLPDVPVVVLTGRVDDGFGPQALAAGAQDFLVKGQVDGSGLERSMRYAVERSRATQTQRELVAAEVRAQENTRLQRGLLPSPLLGSESLRVGSFYRPGSERALLGGDFYDVVQTPSGVHLLIGDVRGHGPDEAALGVALRIAWRALVLAGLPAADVLPGVEQVLFAERSDEEHFATVAMVSLSPDLTSASVTLCGHPAPLLLQGTEVRELVADPLPMLAMLSGVTVTTTQVHLGDEWALLLFTDGLFEGSDRPGSTERLGIPAVTEHLRELMAQPLPRDELPARLLAEAERRHGGPLSDDVAVLLVGTAGWWL